jgi:glycosyltransferase involved in cell wall biosynthesis
VALKVLYTAAHAGAASSVSIGGGGAIARQLIAAWSAKAPFALEVIAPREPAGEIVRYSALEYARFSRRFCRETTLRILNDDPAATRVLVNDISEGPDFALLARRGYQIFTIWHVDVVAFVARMYLGGWWRPETLTRGLRPLERYLPGPLDLVFAKQRACVEHCAGHIVMTDAMKQTILACYPGTDPARIHVIPWGVGLPPLGPPAREPRLLTLSRISPEKGQHRLLEALRGMASPPALTIAGEAAFMGGAAYADKLRRLARGLPVNFAGHLENEAKTAAFASAALYVFPSVSESYGLTLMEALAHGLPVIAWDHDGARAIIDPSFGVLVRSVAQLREAITALLNDAPRRAAMSAAARAYAARHPFTASAAAVAQLLA